MNKRRNKQGNEPQVVKQVIRCNFHLKPVFINENCSDFSASHKSEGEEYCKNCQHSY